ALLPVEMIRIVQPELWESLSLPRRDSARRLAPSNESQRPPEHPWQKKRRRDVRQSPLHSKNFHRANPGFHSELVRATARHLRSLFPLTWPPHRRPSTSRSCVAL